METWKRIEQALCAIISKEIPDEGAITVDPESDEVFLNTSFIEDDEIALTQLSKLLADAIDIRVDPPEEVT